MKIIGRIIIIFVAALLVIGATLALSRSNQAANSPEFASREGFEQRPEAGEGPGDFTGRPEGFGRERGSFSLFGLVEVFKGLGVIAVITMAYLLIEKWLRQRNPQKAVSRAGSDGGGQDDSEGGALS